MTIVTQYFSPEIGAPSTRLHTFARGLADRGHDVQVVCEVPNHPQGVVHEGYTRRPWVRRRLDGFTVTYVWVHTKAEKTTRDRLAFYGTFTAAAALAGSALSKPDIVFASSPPLPVGAAGMAVAARHRVPWVFDVRDLWPEAAVAVGELSNPRLLAAAEKLERRLYASATAITTVTEPFRAKIRAKTERPEKVELLPNGTTRFWVDGAEAEPDRATAGFPGDRFVVTFAGNVGPAQGLHAAVEAAALLDDRFQLFVLGDGPTRQALERRAAGLPAGRVRFHEQVDQETALRFLRASDCLLVPLAPDPILSTFVPSKLFDFCALGMPVIVAASGEPHRLAAERDAALPVPSGDAPALAEAIRRLAGDPALRARLSENARAFGSAHVRDRYVEELEGLLAGVAAGGRQAGFSTTTGS